MWALQGEMNSEKVRFIYLWEQRTDHLFTCSNEVLGIPKSLPPPPPTHVRLHFHHRHHDDPSHGPRNGQRQNDNDNATTIATTATATTTMATTLAPNHDNRGSRRDEVYVFFIFFHYFVY